MGKYYKLLVELMNMSKNKTKSIIHVAKEKDAIYFYLLLSSIKQSIIDK